MAEQLVSIELGENRSVLVTRHFNAVFVGLLQEEAGKTPVMGSEFRESVLVTMFFDGNSARKPLPVH